MARYGLDLGTTTTVLTDFSTGKSVEIAIGNGKDVAILSESSGLRSAKRFLSTETNSSIDCETVSPAQDVEAAVKKLFGMVVTAAKAKGHDITAKDSVRLGCPAAWDGTARQKLVDLALEAGIGLDNFTLVEESVAAGLFWASEQKFSKASTKTLVFDMGGGTLDLSVLEFHAQGGKVLRSEVLASEGSNRAGDYFDCELAKYLSKEIGGVSPKELLNEQSVTKAKEDLSFNKDAALTPTHGGKKLAFRSLTSEDLEKVAKSSGFLQNISISVDKLLRRSYLHAAAVRVGATTSDTKPIPTIVNEISALRAALEKDGSEFASTLAKYPLGILGHEPGNDGEVIEALQWRSLSLVIEGIKHLSGQTLRKEIDNVVFVGGMSLMPLIQKHVAELFPNAEFHVGKNALKKSEIGSKTVLVKDASELVGSVAKGLNDEKALESLNLDRMKYDIILEVPGSKNPIVVHKAFEKVYTDTDIKENHPHLHKVLALPIGLPTVGTGLLRFRSPNGTDLPVTDAATKTKLEYQFGPYNAKDHISYQPRIIVNLTGDVDLYDGHGNHKRISEYFRTGTPVAVDVRSTYEPSPEATER